MKPNSVLFATQPTPKSAALASLEPHLTSSIILVPAQMVSMKTTELATNVLPNVPPVKLPQLVILAPMSTEILTTTVHVLLASTMLESTNVLYATQAVPLALVLLPVLLVMLENSELLRIQFVSVKMDTLNLFTKTEPKSVPNALQNVRPVHKVPLNVLHVTHPSTELKVMTHWEEELVFAKLVITLYPMDHVSNQTVNQTNIAVNVNLILLSVSNVKPMPTELSNSQNTFVFALTDSMKLPMEHANHAMTVVPSVRHQQNVTVVLLKPPTTMMEPADVLLVLSSKFQPTESDIAHNVSNIVTNVQTDLLVKLVKLTSFFQLITLVFVQRTTSSIQRDNVFHVKLVVKLVSPTQPVINVLPHWFLNKTTVSKNAVQDSSSQVPNVLDVQTTVLLVLQPTNVSIVKMASISTEVPVILPVPLVLSPTRITSNVFHAIVHVRPVLTTQVHVQAVSQEKDTYKFQVTIKNVLKNVLKELSHKEEFVKFVTSDVLNVLVLLLTVLPVQLEDIFSTALVGIIAQVSLTMEHVSTNVQQDIGDSLIKNANNAHLNAVLAIPTQLV